MPGPNNSKKKKQQKKKAAKAKRAAQAAHDDSAPPTGEQTPECTKQQTSEDARQSIPKSCTRPRSDSSPQLRSAQTNRPPSHEPIHEHPSPAHYPQQLSRIPQPTSYPPQHEPTPLPAQPFIYDPGNGPRVRDARAFVDSPFFAHAPAFEDPLCAEFAQGEVLEMLRMVLPEEMALILWYNKSRLTSRICPSCRRLYNLGQALPDLIEDGEGEDEEEGGPHSNDGKLKLHPHAPPNPLLEREQMISGLCSPVCFILAAFDYPGAIKSAWGAMAEEMDEEAWEMLNAPANDHLKAALGMLVRMTRLHDLGLAQLLCMPEEGGEEEGEGDEPMQDPIAVKEEKVPSRDRQLVAEVA
ncbi:hypothetical protein K525DRAFT_204212 [Schizophyllum commune Loenen D]|nr:hypothetical protein K525DRAFT_204212 [Schizophyllum commune Loenen D]